MRQKNPKIPLDKRFKNGIMRESKGIGPVAQLVRAKNS